MAVTNEKPPSDIHLPSIRCRSYIKLVASMAPPFATPGRFTGPGPPLRSDGEELSLPPAVAFNKVFTLLNLATDPRLEQSTYSKCHTPVGAKRVSHSPLQGTISATATISVCGAEADGYVRPYGAAPLLELCGSTSHLLRFTSSLTI